MTVLHNHLFLYLSLPLPFFSLSLPLSSSSFFSLSLPLFFFFFLLLFNKYVILICLNLYFAKKGFHCSSSVHPFDSTVHILPPTSLFALRRKMINLIILQGLSSSSNLKTKIYFLPLNSFTEPKIL
ncbi:unnamed protein product [Vicia faba]|uniref:Uncharacterized protein n=1 Tax=Vicia faba TaxID=3906 RepID=A0AAV0Z4Z1_VICFA|nr:unnamed protein product [Vicia faba]